mmetsp:Transcript_23164/g.71212  ORF Transcript_23164/g.71212 Transcript_23164/m.71212 type:complete len:142 (-) Transcript_23164:26-451(-)
MDRNKWRTAKSRDRKKEWNAKARPGQCRPNPASSTSKTHVVPPSTSKSWPPTAAAQDRLLSCRLSSVVAAIADDATTTTLLRPSKPPTTSSSSPDLPPSRASERESAVLGAADVETKPPLTPRVVCMAHYMRPASRHQQLR